MSWTLLISSKGVSPSSSMVKASAERGFSMANWEACSEKSFLSIRAKIQLINFMMLSLRLGGLSCDMSDVLAVAGR